MSEVKPLRWSHLLTLSIVVSAIWGVVWTLARAEHTRIVGELGRSITQGSEREATLALRQMAQLREAPIETFVIAATSPSREVAIQGQRSISELLRNWQTEAKTARGAARVAVRLERLAAALDAQRQSISTLDYPWLLATTERILRIANSAPPADSLDLAMHCESLLALATAPRIESNRDILPVASAAIDQAASSLFAPPSRLALQIIINEELPALDDEADAPPAPPEFPGTEAPATAPTSARPLPRRFEHPQEGDLKVASPIRISDSPTNAAMSPDPWAAIDSRTLLQRWVNAGGATPPPIERELKRRGFGHLRSDVVRLALSDDTQARVQLVDDLLHLPGNGAKAWLLLFADDENADVRLTVVSVMATSRDAELLERAWQVALHDRDPRIAGLADRLRDRRAGGNLR